MADALSATDHLQGPLTSGSNGLASRADDIPQTAEIVETLAGCLAGARVIGPPIERPAVEGDLSFAIGTDGDTEQGGLHSATGQRCSPSLW